MPPELLRGEASHLVQTDSDPTPLGSMAETGHVSWVVLQNESLQTKLCTDCRRNFTWCPALSRTLVSLEALQFALIQSGEGLCPKHGLRSHRDDAGGLVSFCEIHLRRTQVS